MNQTFYLWWIEYEAVSVELPRTEMRYLQRRFCHVVTADRNLDSAENVVRESLANAVPEVPGGRRMFLRTIDARFQGAIANTYFPTQP